MRRYDDDLDVIVIYFIALFVLNLSYRLERRRDFVGEVHLNPFSNFFAFLNTLFAILRAAGSSRRVAATSADRDFAALTPWHTIFPYLLQTGYFRPFGSRKHDAFKRLR